MTDDYLPYGGDPPAQSHSETSCAAAASITHRIGPLHQRVLDTLLVWGELTDEELMDFTDLGGNTLRPRRRELQLMGKIVDSGKRHTTRSGREAVAWTLVDGTSL